MSTERCRSESVIVRSIGMASALSE